VAFDRHVPEIAGALRDLSTIARRIRFVYFSIVFAVIAGAFIGAFVRHVRVRDAGAHRLPAALSQGDFPGGLDPALRATVR